MKKMASKLLIASVLISSMAYAQIPGQLTAMVGEKATYLDSEMERNGYNHIKTEKSDVDSYTYYWNYNSKKCVIARTNDGRVASITSTLAFDCNKGGEQNNGGSYHAAHHHESGSHNPTESVDKAYERGYTDGLHNAGYHNIYKDAPHMNSYADGYDSGNTQRKQNTSYHSGRGGYAAHVQVDDLNGWLATSAYDELKARGFVQEKNYSGGGYTYRVWYHNQTKQCIKTTSQNEKITLVQTSTHCGNG